MPGAALETVVGNNGVQVRKLQLVYCVIVHIIGERTVNFTQSTVEHTQDWT